MSVRFYFGYAIVSVVFVLVHILVMIKSNHSEFPPNINKHSRLDHGSFKKRV